MPRSTSWPLIPTTRNRLLIGEVKLSLDGADVPRLLHALEAKVRSCDWARNKQLTSRSGSGRCAGRRAAAGQRGDRRTRTAGQVARSDEAGRRVAVVDPYNPSGITLGEGCDPAATCGMR